MSTQAALDIITRVQPALKYLGDYAKNQPKDTLDPAFAKEMTGIAFAMTQGVSSSKSALEFLEEKWATLPEEMKKDPEDEVFHTLERVFLHANAANQMITLIQLLSTTRIMAHTFLAEDEEWESTHNATLSDSIDYLHTLTEQEAHRVTAMREQATRVDSMRVDDLDDAASGEYMRYMSMLMRNMRG